MAKDTSHTLLTHTDRPLIGLVKMTVKSIKYIFRRIREVLRKIIYAYEFLLSNKVHIIRSDQYGEVIFQLKEKSIERIYFPKIYNLSKESWVDFFYPKIDVRKFSDAQVYAGSDFILTKDGAVWEKYFKPQWAKTIPIDKALLKIKNQYIFIKKAKHIETIDYGFSLCGVHSTVWAHFLVQYLPKLCLLKEIQSSVNHNLTVLVPIYRDAQIREIVYTYLCQFKNIKVKELEQNNVANCKVLYHIENTSHLSDHANYINPSDIIIPHFTIDILKNNFVNHYINVSINSEDITQSPFRKLYIGRSGIRNVLNHEEIENYFISQGFAIIQPHNLTLKEKVKIFREAVIIVGPFSSGFTNIVFCKPETKVLSFVNYQRIYDGYVSTLAKYFDVDLMFVTGYDQNDSIHSSYNIPLDKIKLAYLELFSSKNNDLSESI